MGKKIAITGGIGSGKSTVLNALKKWGYPVYSCDDIYFEITESQAYVREIEKNFPSCVQNGKINRAILAEIVFEDEEKRKTLNHLAHPLIMETLLARMNETQGLAFAEVPLLFEGKYQSLFDAILIVTRDKAARIRAVMERDGTTAEKVEGRISAQVNYDAPDFLNNLDSSKICFIHNDGTQQELEEELKNLLISLK